MSAHAVITHAPIQGVTLRKVTDGVFLSKVSDRDVSGVEYLPAPIRGAWLLKRNDLDLLADWFARSTAGWPIG